MVDSLQLKVKSEKKKNGTTSERRPYKARRAMRWPVDDLVLLAVNAAQTEVCAHLELAGFLARPALDYDFGFCVELDGVAALAVEDAEEAFFPAAEGEIGHGRSDADVDADVSGGGFVAETAGRGAVRGEEGGLIAVGTTAGGVHGFVHGVGELACRWEAIENCGGKEAARLVIRDFGVATVENSFGSFANTGGD